MRRTLPKVLSFVDGVKYGRAMPVPAEARGFYRDKLRLEPVEERTGGVGVAERSAHGNRLCDAAEAPPPGPLVRYFNNHTEGTGLWKWRHYFPLYARHLARFVRRGVHLVEVGAFSDGSLDMWKEFFGAGARIYGVDIEPACLKYVGDRVKIFIGDRGDPAFWRDFLRQVPRVDVLVDDGGHQPQQQITTLKSVFPALSPGGVYICEDSEGGTHAFHGFVNGLVCRLHSLDAGGRPSVFQQQVASIHLYPFITVIENPPPVPRFECPRHGSIWEAFLEQGASFAGVDNIALDSTPS